MKMQLDNLVKSKKGNKIEMSKSVRLAIYDAEKKSWKSVWWTKDSTDPRHVNNKMENSRVLKRAIRGHNFTPTNTTGIRYATEGGLAHFFFCEVRRRRLFVVRSPQATRFL